MTPHSGVQRDRGAVIPLVALVLPVLVLMTAFAVDLGRQRSLRRDMQAAADVIALDMSRLADGRTFAEIQSGSGVHPPAETALAASAARNGIDRENLELDWGIWDDVNGYQSINLVPTLVPNAAKVVAADSVDYSFQPGSGSASREAVAVHGADPLAGFSVGSFGLNMSTAQAALLTDVLSPHLDGVHPVSGDPVQLDAASYEGLAAADIPLGDLAPHLGAATPRELLDARVPLGDFMLASANVLRNQGRVAEADLVEGSITARMQDVTVGISDYVSAGTKGEDSAMGAMVDLPSVMYGAVFQAQCSTTPLGFEECTALDIPKLTGTLPLLSSSGSLQVIQSPRYRYGPVGTYADTGQIKSTMRAVVGPQHAGDCTPTLLGLNCLLNGVLIRTVSAQVTVDAVVTLAGGRTSIWDIDCSDPAALGLLLQSNTDLYDVRLDVRVDFRGASLLGDLLGEVFGSLAFTGQTSQANTVEDVLFTVAPDVLGQTVKSTGTGSVGLAPVSLSSTGSTGVLSDLATLGLDYTTGSVLSSFVNPVLQDIDATVLTPLADLLGLNVSGSDLVAHAIDCKPGEVSLVE